MVWECSDTSREFLSTFQIDMAMDQGSATRKNEIRVSKNPSLRPGLRIHSFRAESELLPVLFYFSECLCRLAENDVAVLMLELSFTSYRTLMLKHRRSVNCMQLWGPDDVMPLDG